jgi:hypothetical protein
LDVNRSFIFFVDNGLPRATRFHGSRDAVDAERMRRRRELQDVIMHVLNRFPALH